MRLSGLFGTALLSVVPLMASGELSNRRAPGFSLPDSSLKQHDLADYRGKIVLLDLMKTDCPHCQTFSRVLEEVKGKYGDRVAILSVVTYPADNQDTVRRYITTHFITTPILFDCGQMSVSYMKVTPQNSQVSFPHLFLIDGEGMIRNDYAYSAATKEIFEGKALFKELDRMLGAGGVPRKKR